MCTSSSKSVDENISIFMMKKIYFYDCCYMKQHATQPLTMLNAYMYSNVADI